MKRIVSIVLSIIMIISLIGCSNQQTGPIQSFYGDKIDEGVIAGNTEFALDIFKQLNKEDIDKNIFISPLSISTALTMTYEGARGATKDAMGKGLRYKDIPIESINDSYKNLLAYLKQVDKKVDLNVNNSIWIREGQQIQEDFIDINRDVFDAEVTAMDFSKADSAGKINNWIDKATKGKIQKMIDPPIPADVMLYLINAIYFKGQWKNQFDNNLTFKTEFHTEDGSVKDIMMMNRKDDIEYGAGEDFKAVRLPYGDGKTAMYFILPSNGKMVNDLIEEMSSDKWAEIQSSISRTRDVILQIPRFKMEYGIKELNDSLKALGMGEAFSDTADFSGIRDGLFISRVLHKAVIEVNEEGSEAAAVTVVEMTESAEMEPTTFIADRPFLFVIVDEQYKTILFMGKYYDGQ